MADLTVQSQDPTDEVEYANAAAGGDAFVNTGVERAELVAGGGDVVVTFVCQTGWAEHPDAPLVNRTVTVPALSRIRAECLPPRIFNDSTGKVRMTYSGDVGNLLVAIIAAPNPR